MGSAKTLLDASNYLYEFLQYYTGRASAALKEFNPKKLIGQSIEKATPAASYKRIRLVSNIHYEMPDILIGDNYRLQAILDLLAHNSIKFTAEGMVVITAGLFPAGSFNDLNNLDVLQQDSNSRLLQIIVHDTGIGIDADKQQVICAELGSLNFATQGQELGLGLMLVGQLIQEMHGTIESSSEEGKTTTVVCKIPVRLSR